MARIRSIHPGLFTDDAFMEASAHARILIIGIWCEAWDDGVFEWKPITLKARIFPADNVNVVDLLAELENLGFVTRFNSSGKGYGAVRNFRKFQRPKKPNSSELLPPELVEYVGLSSEPVENQFRTASEKSPQMEDGGKDGGWSSSHPGNDPCVGEALPRTHVRERTPVRTSGWVDEEGVQYRVAKGGPF